jgi:hypothetical protein
MRVQFFILIIIISFFSNCKDEFVKKNNLFYSCFVINKSNSSFSKKNKICIDTSKSFIIGNKKYNKLFITGYKDSIYISLKNDTVFSYELDFNYEDISFILNSSLLEKEFRSRFGGYDYTCRLDKWEVEKDNTDTIYTYSFKEHYSLFDGDINYEEAIYPKNGLKRISLSRNRGIISVTLKGNGSD